MIYLPKLTMRGSEKPKRRSNDTPPTRKKPMAPDPKNRSLFGEPNPFDNKLPPAGTSGFGNPAVSAVNDQASADTAAERAGLTAANREATRIASQFSGSGAA